VFARVITN